MNKDETVITMKKENQMQSLEYQVTPVVNTGEKTNEEKKYLRSRQKQRMR